jgi:hypothetical protein
MTLGIDAIAMLRATSRHGESDSGEESEMNFARSAHGLGGRSKNNESVWEKQLRKRVIR